MFPWVFPGRPFTGLVTILAITMGRAIMLLDIIGVHPGIDTTGVLIGGAGTGGITVGTGIEIVRPRLACGT